MGLKWGKNGVKMGLKFSAGKNGIYNTLLYLGPLLTIQHALQFWAFKGNVRFLLDNEVNGNFEDVKRKRVEARIDNPTLNPLFE